MVYLIGLLPLVERGAYLRRILSYLFLQQLLSCQIDSLLETKVCSWCFIIVFDEEQQPVLELHSG
jgi:hypothetical protein